MKILYSKVHGSRRLQVKQDTECLLSYAPRRFNKRKPTIIHFRLWYRMQTTHLSQCVPAVKERL